MQLLMIRHSIAVGPGEYPGRDAARPLTPEGRQLFERISHWIAEHARPLDSIWHSPRVRAVESAEILKAATGLGADQLQEMPWLSSSLDATTLISSLRSNVAETIAVVGHEPDMSRVSSQLIRGGSLRFREGSVAGIDFYEDLIDIGTGSLSWMLDPGLFRA